MKRAKTVPALMYLKPDRLKALNALAERTRIPRAALVREAVDDLLKKYKRQLKP
jgi:predicted transcriptional regulator